MRQFTSAHLRDGDDVSVKPAFSKGTLVIGFRAEDEYVSSLDIFLTRDQLLTLVKASVDALTLDVETETDDGPTLLAGGGPFSRNDGRRFSSPNGPHNERATMSDPGVLTCKSCGEVNLSETSTLYCPECEEYYAEQQEEENAKPRCAHIVSGDYPGPYVTCSNPVRDYRPYYRDMRNGFEVKYCEEHDDVRSKEYADVTLIFEGALNGIETLYDYPAKSAYVDKEEREIREQLDALTPEALADHIANGGAQLEASYHLHEFDSREEYEAWVDDGGECWCESYETLFDSRDEYEPKLRAL